MSTQVNILSSTGSQWLRWDPHIHAPGTLKNDQFLGEWDQYFHALESAIPKVSALGITDYFSQRSYKEFCRRRGPDKLPHVKLVFANIELRLTIETKKKAPINIHLLVSPDDPTHIARTDEMLDRLEFKYGGDVFPCNDAGLTRLGHEFSRNPGLADETALKEGVNQFKVDLPQLQDLFNESEWVRQNVIVAISANEDGLAGLSEDSGFKAQRLELSRFSHLIFSSSPNDRAYWSGENGKLERDKLTPRPCIHGCDAHEIAKVLLPEFERRCWILGSPTFDSLKQCFVEPLRRVHIGDLPPPGPNSANLIDKLTIEGATWFTNREVSFNSGLVTIVGAKGSGKTALVDMLALATGALDEQGGYASFVSKAREHLDGLTATVRWKDGSTSSETLGERALSGMPLVRYLSQQFVERLCAPQSFDSPLIREIEDVVFGAIPEEDRQQCSSFAELREMSLNACHIDRQKYQEAIELATSLIAQDHQLSQTVDALRKDATEEDRRVKSLQVELRSLPSTGNGTLEAEHAEVSELLRELKQAISESGRRVTLLNEARSDIARQGQANNQQLQVLRRKYSTVVTDNVWDVVATNATEESLAAIDELISRAREYEANIRTQGLPGPINLEKRIPVYYGGERGLLQLTQRVGEIDRAIGTSNANMKRRVELSRNLEAAKYKAEVATQKAQMASEAPARIAAQQALRLDNYSKVFETLVTEETVLSRLYQSLGVRLRSETHLSKLGFVIERRIDFAKWCEMGDRLFDYRRGIFASGKTIESIAQPLSRSWKSGNPEDVRRAMSEFLGVYSRELGNCLAQGISHKDLGNWLFSTDHIHVSYLIAYEGARLENLSPGTKGIVLLTLYLALDNSDLRPLIIDQPEENLDPRSVNSELVPFFRDAAKRRQIIMVTHNANLVINTDSDQVIVTRSRRVRPEQLPEIHYESGGLEVGDIRTKVCELLEGGVEAFRKRAARYGVIGSLNC